MTDDLRMPFDEALVSFKKFLRSQEISTDLIWLSRDRLSRNRKIWWVYRPADLTSADSSREFYESVRLAPSSIRIDGHPFTSDLTFAWVEDYGGPSKLLNFGLLTPINNFEIQVVQSRISWHYICLRNGLKNLRHRKFAKKITPQTETPPDLGP